MSDFDYKAFITYSHSDAKVASWLQNSLESYRVPSALAGKKSRAGNEVPRRLRPIFRDRVELPAGGNLSETISDALARSEFLIVLCSPAACQSEWVNLEISEFRKTHGDDHIFCLVVSGEPFASRVPGMEDDECFPPALCYSQIAKRGPGDHAVEPIAADMRPAADGKRLARYKIIAGLIGVGLDDLVQRDAQRRHWRMAAVSAVAVAGMVVMSILSLIAIDARNDEQLRRAEAEDLIEFMLSDLRERLEVVGRLDVLDAVGQEAIAYYSRSTLEQHSEDSLGRRARAFHLLGEVDELRGDMDKARSAFDEAYESTGELLRRSPNDGERIFNHSQSVFWVGFLDWRLSNFAAAESAFLRYISLAEQLVELDDSNMEWLVESGYASVNMGVYLLETGHAGDAIPYFDRARVILEQATSVDPNNRDWQTTLAQAHAWTADAHRDTGSLDAARDHRRIEAGLYQEILKVDPGNRDISQTLIVSHRAGGQLSMFKGNVAAAVEDYAQAKDLADELRKLDSENTFTSSVAVSVYTELAEALAHQRRLDESAALLDTANDLVGDLVSKGPDVLEWKLQAHGIALLKSKTTQQPGRYESTVAQLLPVIDGLQHLAEENPQAPQVRYLLADALLTISNAYQKIEAPTQREKMLEQSIDQLLPLRDDLPVPEIALLARAYAAVGNNVEADKLFQELARIEFRHPRYLDPLL